MGMTPDDVAKIKALNPSLTDAEASAAAIRAYGPPDTRPGPTGAGPRIGLRGEPFLRAGSPEATAYPAPESQQPMSGREMALTGLSAAVPVLGRARGLTGMASRAAQVTGLGAGVYGGAAALEGEPVGPAMLEGATRAAPAGVVAGVLGTIVNPNRHTAGTQAMIRDLKKATDWSANVRGVLNERDPVGFWKSGTVLKMKEAASQNMQGTINALAKEIGEDLPITLKSIPPDMALRYIKEVRQATAGTAYQPGGALQIQQPGRVIDPRNPKAGVPADLRVTAQPNLKDAVKIIQNMKKSSDPQMRAMAYDVEDELVDFLDQKSITSGLVGTALGAKYREATGLYRRDKTRIKFIEALQRAQEGPGGVNLVDFPSLGQAAQSGGVPVGTPGLPGRSMNIAYDLMVAASHPTSAWGIGHGLRGVGTAARGSSMVYGPKVRDPFTPGQRLGRRAIAGIGTGGAALAGGMIPLGGIALE